MFGFVSRSEFNDLKKEVERSSDSLYQLKSESVLNALKVDRRIDFHMLFDKKIYITYKGYDILNYTFTKYSELYYMLKDSLDLIKINKQLIDKNLSCKCKK